MKLIHIKELKQMLKKKPDLLKKIEVVPKQWNFYDTERTYIEFYREQELSIIPLKRGTKEPAVKWEEYQKRKATNEEIEKWFFSQLATKDFFFQFCTFMIHYFRETLHRQWYDQKEKEWITKTKEILYKEPWVYSGWHEGFPNTTTDFYDLLISKDFIRFVKDHVEKKAVWGWTKLFNKESPELLNLIVRLIHAQTNVKEHKEATKACQNLLEEVKEFWLAGYPDQLRITAKNNITIGEIVFSFLTQHEEDEKLTAAHVASMLKMHVTTCRRTVMPTFKKFAPFLKLFGVEFDTRSA